MQKLGYFGLEIIINNFITNRARKLWFVPLDSSCPVLLTYETITKIGGGGISLRPLTAVGEGGGWRGGGGNLYKNKQIFMFLKCVL